MEDKRLALESKSSIALDLGRSYIEYFEIDDVCLKTFPDEALTAGQAFKNVMNGDIYDPGEENKGFSNHVGWLEPVKETTRPFEQDVQTVLKTAEKIRKNSKILAIIASGPAYLAARAGVNFFESTFIKGTPEIVFLGCCAGSACQKKNIDKLKGQKVSLCVIEDGELSPEANASFNAVKALLGGKGKYYAFTNNSKSAFASNAAKNGIELFTMPERFTGPAIITSPAVLLPLALGGVDINELLDGADLEPNDDMESFVPSGCAGAGASRELMIPLSSLNIKNYSVSRHLLKNKGYGMELLVYTDGRLEGFANWLKYLYSQNSSSPQMLYVDSVNLLQHNNIVEYANLYGKNFFETLLNIGNLASSQGELKDSTDLDTIGNALLLESMQKQRKSGVPIMRVEMKAPSAYYFGQMISMFSRTAAIMDIWK